MDNKPKTKPQKLLEATITLCAALSLAAALLAWLAPWAFPFEMLAEFRRQFRILAAITIPLAFLINTKPIKKAALSITALAAVLLQTAALLPWDSQTHPSPKQPNLTVLQANLYKRNGDLKRLETLLTKQADILFLFEFSPIHEPLLETAKPTYPHQLRNKDLVVLSRWPLKRIPLKNPGERIDLLTIATPTGPLQAGIVHPTIPLGPQRWKARNWVLNQMATEIARQPSPKLLVGDFNTTNFSHTFAEMERISGCRDTARGRQHEGTWRAKLWLPFRIPLDHLLASPELEVTGKQTGPSIGSDHLPVITTLKLKPQSGNAEPQAR